MALAPSLPFSATDTSLPGEKHRADIELEYQYKLSEKFSLGAAWRLAFIHAGKPVDLFSYQHSLNVMIGLKL